ncbi:MAG: peptidoglycan DD-metalloendopeptidase family protein [Actinomycetaceae bacterium]|nr:peptidoglycan DD-metalloendopeptidase family protein [Actinomycetaceae bacterium]MDU0970207.1 peptidoglycan DD-metalloendopeptidase family protein [Actinomycetaceae bacterium]
MRSVWARLVAVLVVACACVIGSAWTVPSAHSDSRDDAVRRQQQAKNKADEARSALEGVNADLASAVLKVSDLQTKLAGANAELDQANAKLAAAERTQTSTADQLAAAQSDLKDLSSTIDEDEQTQQREHRAIGSLARSEYVGQSGRNAFVLLLGDKKTSDFADAAQAAGMVAQVHERQIGVVEQRLVRSRSQRERQDALAKQVSSLKQTADAQVEAAAQAKQESEEAKKHVEDLTNQAKAAQTSLESKKASLQNDLSQAQAAQAAASQAIAQIDAENRRNAAASAGLSGSKWKGKGTLFTSPLHHSLYITSPYGYRIHPILGYRKLHMGVDLQSACGEQQFAALGGRVVSTVYEGSGGNTVTINHGLVGGISWVTKYRHMTRFAVTPGQQVKQGQLIGYTGATGNVTGCHVHFEIWKNGTTIDPMTML